MTESDALLKSFANHVASAVSTDAAVTLLRLLRAAGFMDSAPAPAEQADAPDQHRPQADAPGTRRARVGIWERKEGSTRFIRRLDLAHQWFLWANVGRIEAKSAGRRVVLLGESVARGYLYDPQFTPAKALETILTAELGQGRVDVVDLARTNLQLDRLRAVAASALVLDPDVVVIFAGNNWLGAGFRADERADVAAAVREHGISGLKSVMEAKHREAVRATVREIVGLYRRRGVAVVWVIPEFNLGDWRDPVTNAPYLLNGSNETWLRHCDSAHRALDTGDLTSARAHAQAMVDLDGGTTVAGPYILAECSSRQGDVAAKRAYLESARDALIWTPFTKTPRPYAITHAVLREEIPAAGGVVVDLPRLFTQHLNGGIADRRLFVDYCHLNADGIRLAMAAVAARVCDAIGAATVSPDALVDRAPAPSDSVQAEAMFLAAVHNAHWHQSYSLVHHYCLSALRASSHLAAVMLCFLDVQTRRSPMLMCRAAQQIEDLDCPSIRYYLLRWNMQRLDRVLVDAIVDALRTVGIDAHDEIARLRIEERSAVRNGTDLLDSYYGSSAEPRFAQHEAVEEMQMAKFRSDCYRAYSPESRFVFIGEAGHDVTLSIACRLAAQARGEACIEVEVNGAAQTPIPADRAWRRWSSTVAGASIRDGLNEVTLRWPAPDISARAAIDAAADDLIANMLPDFFPVWGDIHSFTVSGGAARSERAEAEVTLSIATCQAS